jgi:hypothetical protein
MTWLALPGASTDEPASPRIRTVEKRFFVQSQTMDPPHGSNAIAWFDTLTEAQEAADKIWRVDGRQEITDQESGAILVRGNDPAWRPLRVAHSAT